jgi:hypothetical protein
MGALLQRWPEWTESSRADVLRDRWVVTWVDPGFGDDRLPVQVRSQRCNLREARSVLTWLRSHGLRGDLCLTIGYVLDFPEVIVPANPLFPAVHAAALVSAGHLFAQLVEGLLS